MRVPVTTLSIVTLSVAAFFCVAVLTAGGQAARGQAPAGSAIPRAADGKPDLSGIWQVLDNSLDGNIEPQGNADPGQRRRHLAPRAPKPDHAGELW